MSARDLNPEMVVLAREYRNMTQQELGRRLYISQAKVARIEGGLLREPPPALVERIAQVLQFPETFFYQPGLRLGFGSSALYYRKRSEITASDRKHITGVVNLVRMGLAKLLAAVELEPSLRLPRFDIEEFGGSAGAVARAVRSLWNVPDGPLPNLTRLIESAGVIIVPCSFNCRALDATSLQLNDLPPIIFISRDLPGDRWRFTLAHELGHLVLHEVPRETMEDEADEFAAELLVPADDITPTFKRLRPLRLQDLADLKPYWRVSMASLLHRADDLGFLSAAQKQYLWRTMSKAGFRRCEPVEVPREQCATFQSLVDYHVAELKYSPDELSHQLHLLPSEFDRLFGVAKAERHLRAV